MGDLLKEIQILSPEAADVLKKAGLESDSDIQSLTREDLHDLLPGAGDFKLRKNVFEMIQKSGPPNMPQKELGELLNNLASSAQIDPGVIMDHNRFIDEQLLIVQLLLDDTKDLQKKIYTGQPDSKAVKGAVMGDLLKEIQIMSPEAADVLKQAGFETDSDIQSLTREDLHDLLPGVENLRLRKDVFNMIHTPRPPNMLLKELEELQSNLASSAQIDPGVSMDVILSINEQLINVQLLLKDNVDLLKTINTRQPDSKAGEGAVMGDLWKEIQIMSPEAADVLKQAGFETDTDIRSLTREDLNELLPGVENLRLRKDLFNMIHTPRPGCMLLKELEDLQSNLASSAQIDPGVIMDHIRFINEQLTTVQLLLQDNVDLLKTINTRQPDSKAEKGDSNARTSAHNSKEVTVKYKVVVGGETFGANTQLMDQVNHATKGNVRLLENPDDSQIIIVFCPITSRVESDVKAAMTGVPGDKPVILVKMHHVCKSKASLCFNTSIDDRNIVLQVNVFFHENLRGLLECPLNKTAVYEIQQKLLKQSVLRSIATRASTSGQGPSKWQNLNPLKW